MKDARGVIFRVSRKHEQQVERQSHRVPFDLHVAFLHDVEQTYLDFAGQIRKLIDGENAAVGARNKPVMNCQLIGDVLAAARRFDGIDIANHVRDGYVGRGQLFHVTMVLCEPGNRSFITLFRDEILASAANGRVRAVVDFATRNVRHHRVEQRGQQTDQARLGLPAQAQQNEIMPRKNGVHNLGHNTIVVTDNAGEQRFTALEFADQIAPQLVFHGSFGNPLFRKFTST